MAPRRSSTHVRHQATATTRTSGPPSTSTSSTTTRATTIPVFVYELVRLITTPISLRDLPDPPIEVDNVPADGPLILAANHFSQTATTSSPASGCGARSASWRSRSCSAEPVLTYIYKHGGVFPVRRGHHDEEAFETAHAILDQGGCCSSTPRAGARARGKLGEAEARVGRIALETGVAGRPGRDPRLAEGPRLEATCASRRSRSSSASRSASRVEAPSRERQLEVAARSSPGSARCTRSSTRRPRDRHQARRAAERAPTRAPLLVARVEPA